MYHHGLHSVFVDLESHFWFFRLQHKYNFMGKSGFCSSFWSTWNKLMNYWIHVDARWQNPPVRPSPTKPPQLHIKLHSSAQLCCAPWCFYFQCEVCGAVVLAAAWWSFCSSARRRSTFHRSDWAARAAGCWRRCWGTLHLPRSDTEEKISTFSLFIVELPAEISVNDCLYYNMHVHILYVALDNQSIK